MSPLHQERGHHAPNRNVVFTATQASPISDSADCCDYVTVLTARGRDKCLTKRVFLDEDGAITKKPYDRATFFNVEQRPVNDLIDFANVLLDVQPNVRQCLVRGRLRSGHDTAYNVRRSLDPRKTPEPTFTEGRHYWLPIDVDDWHIPAGIADVTRRKIVDGYIVTELPAEFHDVSYVLQWSSSEGLPGFEGVLNCHLWFWADQPHSDGAMRRWAHWINKERGRRVVDPMFYASNEPLYTAAPIFAGIADPLPENRLELVRRKLDVVALKMPPVNAARTRPPRRCGGSTEADSGEAGYQPRHSPYAPGKGWRRFLDRMGDDRCGFHEPTRDCIASYIRATGYACDAEFIKGAIRSAARAAYAKPTRDVEASIADEVLDDLIASAFAKYGALRARYDAQVRSSPLFPSFSLPPDTPVSAQPKVRRCYSPRPEEEENNTYALGEAERIGGGGGREERKDEDDITAAVVAEVDAEFEAEFVAQAAADAMWQPRDDFSHGLPQIADLTYARVDLMDNGKRKGKAQYTAKIHFTTASPDYIDRYELPARFVDFTSPERFKRTMLNHLDDCSENDRQWYENHRKIAMEMRREEDIADILIGHVQRRWFGPDGASHLYRYRRQIAFLIFNERGDRRIIVVHDDATFAPKQKVERAARDKKLKRRSDKQAAIAVYYHDPLDYFGAKLAKKTAFKSRSTNERT